MNQRVRCQLTHPESNVLLADGLNESIGLIPHDLLANKKRPAEPFFKKERRGGEGLRGSPAAFQGQCNLSP